MKPWFVFGASVLATLGVCPESGLAWACGPSPSPSWTIGATTPAAGATAVPLNTGVHLEGLPWDAMADGSFTLDEWSLTRRDDGQPVAGEFLLWYADAPAAVWAPETPLAPNTTYDAVARVGEEQPETAEEGSYLLEFSFTTGGELLDPLAVLGELEVQVEVFEEGVLGASCQDPCGAVSSCEPTGKRAALRASITVPPLTGGNAALGYQGWLSYSMNEATAFDGPGEGEVPASSEVNLSQGFRSAPGEPVHLYMRLVGEGAPYAPCFAFNAWDSGGQHVTTSRCLEPLDIEALEAEAERQRTQSDAGVVAEPSDDTDDPDGGVDDPASDDSAALDADSDDADSSEAGRDDDNGAAVDGDLVGDAGTAPGNSHGELGEPSTRAASEDSSGCALGSRSPASQGSFALLAVVVVAGALRRRKAPRGSLTRPDSR